MLLSFLNLTTKTAYNDIFKLLNITSNQTNLLPILLPNWNSICPKGRVFRPSLPSGNETLLGIHFTQGCDDPRENPLQKQSFGVQDSGAS